MIEYTKEQQEAIDYFDNNLLLSASAGSGKTQVLLEKVVKLIESGVSLSEILMVTFTNLAATEMKNKLENMLIEKQNLSLENSDKIFDALNKINSSDISTLHSFCQKLVREYYYLLNLEPNFEIADDTILSKLKNMALDETIKYYLEKQDEDFIEISNLFVYKRDYTKFKKEVLSFYEFLVSKVDKFNFIEKLIKNNYNTNINTNSLIKQYKDFSLKKLEFYKSKFEECVLRAKQIGSKKLEEIASSFYGKIETTFKNNEDFIKFCITKHDFVQVRKNNAVFEELELKEDMQKLSSEIKELLLELNNNFALEKISELEVSLSSSERILYKFLEVIKRFEENFNLLKTQINCLDFNDLENLTLKLFKNDKILEEISKRYKYIFVDEYQDTNSVQEEILNKISKFSIKIMVGDIKQSIYAFRECNPKIFNDKLEVYSSDETKGKVILLNKNFRSRKTILEFSNLIFSNLMRKENSGYSYKDLGKFIAGREEENIQNNLKPVEILCIDSTKEKKKAEEDIKNESEKEKVLNLNSKNDESDISKEDLLVINSIDNLLNQKIIENDVERSLTYKDIAIISRKRNEKIISLCKALDKFKIPYSVKYKEEIYKSFEVKIILSYLNILNNFENEISLCSILKNIYGFTSNELLTIKTTSISSGIKNYSKKDCIYDKISRFFSDFNEINSWLNEISIKELVVKIIKKLKLDIILLKSNGKISLEKINIFINNISSKIFSLSEFLNLSKENENKKFEVRKVTGENAIVIDTFHSTKGLEYNAVIIYSGGEKIFSREENNLIYNAKFGVGVFNFDKEKKIKKPSCVFNMISSLNKGEELNEEVRLSYVAFTRAKNFLIVIGKEKLINLKQETNLINFLNFNSYMSLIFSSKEILNQKDFNIQVLKESDDIFLNKRLRENKKENLSNEIIRLDNQLEYKFFDLIKNKKYDYIESINIQLKNSVTSISNDDKDLYNISNFKITDIDKEDYIALGNAYHEALEKLPFHLKTLEEVRNKMKELIELKQISPNIYDFVEDEKLLNAILQIKKLINENDKIYKEHNFMIYVPYNLLKKSNVWDKILVQGIIDLFIEKENEIILIDYKTSKLNDINLINKYDTQLSLYSLALKEKYKNKKIKKYIYSIFLDKLINIV